ADVASREERLDEARLVALAAREDERERLAAPFGSHVNLGREAPAAPAERLVLLIADGARRVLVRPHDGVFYGVRLPVELPGRVSGALQPFQHPRPDARRCPPVEPAPSGCPRAARSS
ncbi:MAG: hypothetical protein JWO88_3730, partial [Frankiales bacterium]|nr:hypothetical protein [Frankiales bacterium]